MSTPPNIVYTYRGGRRIALRKSADEFVVRATGPAVDAVGARKAIQMASASTRLTVRPEEMGAKMAKAREIAPTHHAYQVADTDAEFLITDRVMVRFKPGTPVEAIDALMA